MSARMSIGAGLFLVAGCVAALAHPGPEDALRAGVSVERLEADRALYVGKCSGCHALHLPGERPGARWPAAVRDMADEAKLDHAEREAIERFLTTMAAGPDAGMPSAPTSAHPPAPISPR